MNYLLDLDHLSNRYFAMRHGHSLANQQGIIVSDPQNGCEAYGLSQQGRTQLQASLQGDTGLDNATVIITSDFARALESAEIVREWLQCEAPVSIDVRLRERYFGELELGPDDAYAAVWKQDAQDVDAGYRGSESVQQVMARVTELVLDLERRYRDNCILLVSHGDALQILQTAFARRSPSAHRSLDHLQTAEIRPLMLTRLMG